MMDSQIEVLDLTAADLAGEEDWLAPCVWVLPSRSYGIVALGYRDGAIRGGWGRDVDDAIEVTSMPDPPILVPFSGADETGPDRLTSDAAAAELARVGVLLAEPPKGNQKPAVPNGVAVSQWGWQVVLMVLAVSAAGLALEGRVGPPLAVLGLLAIWLHRLAVVPAMRIAETWWFRSLAVFWLVLCVVWMLIDH